MTFHGRLVAVVGNDRVGRSVPLADLTTFRVGGRADWLVETRSVDETVAVVQIAHSAGLGVSVLGGGSNVLVADEGVRGVVLRIHGGTIQLVDDRHVRADAGVTINGLVRWMIAHGVQGLESWAGTPGTVGGAICGNAHFEGRLIGELVERVRLVARDGTVRELSARDMEFAYDRSRLQRTGEILLSATFVGAPGDPVQLRRVARRSLEHRKQTQPLGEPSAGCVFQNPPAAEVPPGVPASAGALIDRAGLKGRAMGGAAVSSSHANFIVNRGGATARDVRALIELCRRQVFERFGVHLEEEVVYLGETSETAKGS